MKQMRYTAEQREWAISQMMPPINRAVAELAKATGITTVTLRTWQAIARADGRIVPGAGKRREHWSSADKFRMVMEAAPLSEEELSAYCRTKGIYPEQVRHWRLLCEQANEVVHPAEKLQAKQIRRLERDLQKKEAALAEAEALQVMTKKANAIWGERN